MTVEERVEAMLIRYLKAEHNIDAESASFYGTIDDSDSGCDTCGWGSKGMYFELWVKPVDSARIFIEVDGDPLNFFPTLLKYDTED